MIADKLFVQSSETNCKIDNDQILLDISSVAMAKTTTTVRKDALATDSAADCNTPLALPMQNVAVYMAGYLLRKFPFDKYADCEKLFKLEEIPDSQEYQFLKYKTYKETGSLVSPAPAFVAFVQNLEGLFISTFTAIVHMPVVVGRLCNTAHQLLSTMVANKKYVLKT